MDTITKNKVHAILAYGLRTAALLCATGSLMQTFLSTIGFSEQYIYLHASLYQAANVSSILLFARFADRGNLLHRVGMVQIPGALLFLCYLPLCAQSNAGLPAYLWLLAITFMQSVTMALHTVCEYKVPYFIYRPEEYGGVMAICGVVAGAVSFGVGALMSALSVRFSYSVLMTFAFVIACLFLAGAGALQYSLKSLRPADAEGATDRKQEKIPLSAMFRHEAFSHLLVGNLTRGFANGTTTVLAAAALSLGYDETLTTAMVSAQSLAILAGCALFGVVSRRTHPRYAIFAGSLCFLALPLMLLRDMPVLFLAMYAIVLFGRTLIDYAVPSALLYAVPVEIAGTYNAWRMILHNGGTMLATTLAGFMPLPALIVVTVVAQLVSGLNFLCARVMRKKD